MASARKIVRDIATIRKGTIIWQGATRMVDRSGAPDVDQCIQGKVDGPSRLVYFKREKVCQFFG